MFLEPIKTIQGSNLSNPEVMDFPRIQPLPRNERTPTLFLHSQYS